MASVSAISSDAMPSNRPNLTLDEQSFQRLLSAAFTIREHNDRRKLARQTPARRTQAEPEAHLHPEPEAEGKSQWITEAAKDLTPEDPAPEHAELTVQPFQLSTHLIAGDEPVTNDAGYGHVAVYHWQWSVSFWPI